MARKAQNSQPDKARLRRGERPRIFYCMVFLGFGLYVFNGITGEITGGYPFLSMAIMAKEGEGRHAVGTINRAQQAYFLEKGTFATSVAALKLDMPTETPNYRYRIVSQADPQLTIATGDAKQEGLKSYRGAVRQITEKDGKRTTIAIFCLPIRSRRSWLYGTPKPPAMPYYSLTDKKLHCGEGSLDVSL